MRTALAQRVTDKRIGWCHGGVRLPAQRVRSEDPFTSTKALEVEHVRKTLVLFGAFMQIIATMRTIPDWQVTRPLAIVDVSAHLLRAMMALQRIATFGQ
jgi:hypothetical protein